MIAHVAEAGESRGRVVLRYSVGDPSPTAIAAAVCVARAFQAEIESLFIEDTQLLEMAKHPFVTETSFGGRTRRAVTRRGLVSGFRASFVAARRRIEAAARAADVPFIERVVRDEPVHALAAACAQNGPWNVIALAEPFGSGSGEIIRELFEQVRDATGLVLAGPAATRTKGPVVVVAEDLERLPGMLRLAERVATAIEDEVVLALLADDDTALAHFDGEVRLALADRTDVRILQSMAVHGEPAAAAEVIRRLRAGFVIAHFGGVAAPRDAVWRPLATALECPLFLVR